MPNAQQQNDVEMLQAVLADDESFLEGETRAEPLPGRRRTAEQAIAELVAACGLAVDD